MRKTLRFVFILLFIEIFSSSIYAKQISAQRQAFIDCSISLLGTPYLWSGKSPDPGIDCSGLVAFAARKAIKVSYTGSSRAMYKNCIKITDEQREPGDLLFFSSSNSIDSISHVAIYLGRYSGEGEYKNKRIFIHSVSDGTKTGVIITSLDDTNYWTNHYVASGRFLPSSEYANKIIQEKGYEDGMKALQSSEKLFEIDTWWKDVDSKWFE